MNKTILLIEDDMLIRELYVTVLTKGGYQVDSAGDGEVGLTKAREVSFDLILLDVMLPKVTGVDVLSSLKKDPQYKSHLTPVIIVTNLGEGHILDAMLELGAVKYLLKAETNNQDLLREINSFFVQMEVKN